MYSAKKINKRNQKSYTQPGMKVKRGKELWAIKKLKKDYKDTDMEIKVNR